VVGEDLRQGAGEGPAVGHDVGDPGRDPHVVLEHPEPAVAVAHEVDAADVHPNPIGRGQPGDHPMEVRRTRHHGPRHHLVVEEVARPVDVIEEPLEGPHPLSEPHLDRRPGVGVEQPRHDVQRERPFLAADVEGHALLDIDASQEVRTPTHVRRTHPGQPVVDVGVPRSNLVRRRLEHLVEGALAGGIPGE
jgi:hypothetical protein